MHLIIIFGVFWSGKSFSDKIGKTMSAFEATGSAIVLILLMIVVAKFWGWLKKKYPKHAQKGLTVLAAVLIIAFIIS
jgi:membrane-anchored protein YejM (alkaline phosphatase superfamily)